MERAKNAFRVWKKIDLRKRAEYLSSIRQVMVDDLEYTVAEVKRDTGKADVEVLMTDVLPTVDIIKYYEGILEDVLGTDSRKTPLFLFGNKSWVEYSPMGVVLVISPWNFPLQLSFIPTITAIAAGNAVLLKPSEITPFTGRLIEKILSRAGLPENLVQVLTGGGEVGSKLIDAGPDKIFFTGSVSTGKKIMKKASDTLIPIDLEMGGKDPMIVFSDADIDRAVEGAVYGGFANSGQLCISVERLYVQSNIFEDFVKQVVARANELRVGSEKDSDLGPMIYEGQIDIVEDHIDDAIDRGAKLHTDRKRKGRLLYPQVLTEVNHDMKIMTEETFGPVLPVMSFDTEEEAIKLANDSRYGLNSSVWSKDIDKAKRVVNKLEVGNSYINDAVKNTGNPHLPFGGTKWSGIGHYHGPEGLLRFSNRTSVMINHNSGSELNWFPYSKKLYSTLKKLIHTNYGDPGFITRAKNLISLYLDFR